MTDPSRQYQLLVLAINFRRRRGPCHGVRLYNLICYQVGQLLQQSLQQSLHQPRPPNPSRTVPAFQQLSDKCDDYKSLSKLHNCSLCHSLPWPLAVTFDLIHNSPPNQTTPPPPRTEMYFPPHLKCLDSP